MAETSIQMTSRGLRLDAPQIGDIVTVRIKPKPKRNDGPISGAPGMLALLTGSMDQDEADSPQHYRMNSLWRVLAVNGGQAVVEQIYGYDKERREIWSISHHDWFEASDLLAALDVAP